MEILTPNACVKFVSNDKYYDKERSGAKSNTVRQLSDDEMQLIKTIKPTLIQITHTSGHRCFIRTLTDISYSDRNTIFSWNREETRTEV